MDSGTSIVVSPPHAPVWLEYYDVNLPAAFQPWAGTEHCVVVNARSDRMAVPLDNASSFGTLENSTLGLRIVEHAHSYNPLLG